MALDQNAQYPVGTDGPSAEYPEGSSLNSSSPGALDGYPWEKEGINDLFGFQQALLRVAGISASGSADTALVSEYLQGLIELASGRAFNYDDSGAADAYVLDVQTNQQAPASLFDGMVANYIPGNTNTGASTVNVVALGVVDIKLPGGVSDPLAGDITATVPAKLVYRTAPSAHFELDVKTFSKTFTSTEQTIAAGGALVLAHGLGVSPVLLQARLVCKVADSGYSIGDEVLVDIGSSSTTVVNDHGLSVVPDAANLNIRIGANAAQSFVVLNKGTGVSIAIANASWKLVLRAWS